MVDAKSRWLSARPDGLRIAIKVTPRAARTVVEGVATDASGRAWLAVRLTEAPESGRANAALIRLLAKRWGLAARDLRLISGAGARHKILGIDRPDPELYDRLLALEAPRERAT